MHFKALIFDLRFVSIAARHRFINMYDSLPEIVQPHHFQPTDGHHFVEIRSIEDDDLQVPSTVQYEDGILTDDEISQWLHQPVIPLFPLSRTIRLIEVSHTGIRPIPRNSSGSFGCCNVPLEIQLDFCIMVANSLLKDE